MSQDTDYESELAASRADIAVLLRDVADGIQAGAIRLGDGTDAVTVDVPEELSLELELETEDEDVNLELELEWPAPNSKSFVTEVRRGAGGSATATGTSSRPVGRGTRTSTTR